MEYYPITIHGEMEWADFAEAAKARLGEEHWLDSFLDQTGFDDMAVDLWQQTNRVPRRAVRKLNGLVPVCLNPPPKDPEMAHLRQIARKMQAAVS